MKNRHPSDFDIQKFAFDQLECEPHIIQHIRSCEKCSKIVETYLSLSTIIKDQPEPTLDYNLSKLVLDQLPVHKEVKTSHTYLIYFINLTIIGLALLSVILFKETITHLVGNSLTYQNYLSVSIIVFISVVLVLDIFRVFNKKIELLNS